MLLLNRRLKRESFFIIAVVLAAVAVVGFELKLSTTIACNCIVACSWVDIVAVVDTAVSLAVVVVADSART